MTRTNLSIFISADGYVAGPTRARMNRSVSAVEPLQKS